MAATCPTGRRSRGRREGDHFFGAGPRTLLVPSLLHQQTQTERTQVKETATLRLVLEGREAPAKGILRPLPNPAPPSTQIRVSRERPPRLPSASGWRRAVCRSESRAAAVGSGPTGQHFLFFFLGQHFLNPRPGAYSSLLVYQESWGQKRGAQDIPSLTLERFWEMTKETQERAGDKKSTSAN